MGNVLVGFCHEKMIRQVAAVCDADVCEMRTWLMSDGHLQAFERGDYSEPQMIEQIETRFAARLTPEVFQCAFSDIFTLTPGIQPVLQRLRDAGIRMILLSNTSISHIQFIERQFDVLDFMDARVTSFAVKASKPEPAIYQAALQAADCRPDECFYTDDIAEYVDAASRTGIVASQFVNSELLERRLEELNILS